MSDKRFERLKRMLFTSGAEEFIGTSLTGLSYNAIDGMMDEVYEQMPEEELDKFYEKYGI